MKAKLIGKCEKFSIVEINGKYYEYYAYEESMRDSLGEIVDGIEFDKFPAEYTNIYGIPAKNIIQNGEMKEIHIDLTNCITVADSLAEEYKSEFAAKRGEKLVDERIENPELDYVKIIEGLDLTEEQKSKVEGIIKLIEQEYCNGEMDLSNYEDIIKNIETIATRETAIIRGCYYGESEGLDSVEKNIYRDEDVIKNKLELTSSNVFELRVVPLDGKKVEIGEGCYYLGTTEGQDVCVDAKGKPFILGEDEKLACERFDIHTGERIVEKKYDAESIGKGVNPTVTDISTTMGKIASEVTAPEKGEDGKNIDD